MKFPPANITIAEVTAPQILLLRHRELRPGGHVESARYLEDSDPTTHHFAALLPTGEAISCATLILTPWQDTPAYRLRGMATAESYRGQGLGARVLTRAETTARGSALVSLMWCDARLAAVPFYEKQGWQIVSALFEIAGFGPHYKMTKPL